MPYDCCRELIRFEMGSQLRPNRHIVQTASLSQLLLRLYALLIPLDTLFILLLTFSEDLLSQNELCGGLNFRGTKCRSVPGLNQLEGVIANAVEHVKHKRIHNLDGFFGDPQIRADDPKQLVYIVLVCWLRTTHAVNVRRVCCCCALCPCGQFRKRIYPGMVRDLAVPVHANRNVGWYISRGTAHHNGTRPPHACETMFAQVE